MGGSKSKPATSYTAPTTVWDQQAPFLQDTYQQAQNIFNQQQALGNPGQASLDQFGAWLGQAGNQFGGANSALDQALAQYQASNAGLNQGYGVLGQANAGLNQGYGVLGQAAQGFGGLMNPGQNPMSQVYARLAGQQFNEQIMPALRGDAMVGGGLGGSRAGIAQGLAGARMGESLRDWNAQLYNEDMNRVLQASQGLSGLGSAYGGLAGVQGQLGSAYGGLAGQQAGIAQGIGQLGGARAGIASQMAELGRLYGGYAGMQQAAPWANIEQYRSLIGNPTMVGGGGSSTGATQGSSGAWGTVIGLAGAALAPVTGGASLLAAGAANQAVNSYYK